MRKARYAVGVAAVMAVMTAFPAIAQNAAEGTSESDIIVTAQRRAELLQDVSITIPPLSDDRLREAKSQQLGDIVRLTPAVRFEYQSDFVQPTIRGVGNAVVSAGAGSNVGIYIDGFYSPNPLAGDFQLLNLEASRYSRGLREPCSAGIRPAVRYSSRAPSRTKFWR